MDRVARPAPRPASEAVAPCSWAPVLRGASRAIGIDAAEVLPDWTMSVATSTSERSLTFCMTASIIRRLAPSSDAQRSCRPEQRALHRDRRHGRRATRIGRALPHHRRWAMRADLAEYAQHYALSDESTLVRYLAERVSKRSDLSNVTANALASWMRQWPWFLVLDGLDEVTEPAVRKRLIEPTAMTLRTTPIERVVEFVTNAEALNCDVLVVLTTRPVGHAKNIAPTQFERIDLDYLEPADAVRYGTLATKVRLRDDRDRIDKIVGQLNKAAEDEALRNLLRTPLHVLVLTIILGSAGQLAPDRYSLFWSYYDVGERESHSHMTTPRRHARRRWRAVCRRPGVIG